MGIDLGTTHTVVAYAEIGNVAEDAIQLFPIEQLVAPGEVAPRNLLPSFRYHPAPEELAPGDDRLPWTESDPGGVSPVVLGELARELGSKVPGRLIASAKSWLSHTAVDRTAPILPWGRTEGVPQISPVAASASYLNHIRAAWNSHFNQDRLEQQDVVLTVPASFDEGARRLTVEAAHVAGLTRIHLLEEPQAACYDWIHRHRDKLESLLEGIRLLLVCDVGGGTTDLTLIRITPTEEGPVLTRIGVGNHLMLGGDNMDLTLAHRVEKQLGDKRLSAAELSQLIQQCRAAKERLLAPDGPAQTTVTLVGSGAKLIAGARSATLTREEVDALVVDGFLPQVPSEERPQRRRGAILEFGLPYAADPAISRHLAAFLHDHAQPAREALADEAAPDPVLPMPDAVLLNGGVFHSQTLSRRLLEVLAGWRGAPLRQLHNADPDLAVARGAVAYAMARRGQGLRIGGGSARSYFLVVESTGNRQQGVCLLPQGTEEGLEIRLMERTFSLRLGQPVRFHLVSSSAADSHRPGEIIAIDYAAFTPLPPIATVLQSQRGAGEVPVQLVATLTEIGTLEIHCVAMDDPAQRWQLAFQLRGEAAEAVMTDAVHPRFAEAAALIERLYGSRSRDVGAKEIKTLRTDLEKILGKREQWDTPLLRELFGAFWEGVRRRRRSPDHERLWLSLTGYCLRPGCGYPLDEWRVHQVWSLYEQGIQYVSEAQIWSEWWTLWRRIAGGLDEQDQQRLLNDIAADLKPVSGKVAKASKSAKGAKGARRQSVDDMIQLAAFLERLPLQHKVETGEVLLQRLQKKGESSQTWWAVGRIGTRVPLYGSSHNVVPPEVAIRWLNQVLDQNWRTVQPAASAAVMLARMTGDRQRDLPMDSRQRVAQRLQSVEAPTTWQRMIQEVIQLDEADESQMFGEGLPPGLRLVG